MKNFIMGNVKGAAILAGIFQFGNQIVPFLPQVWANLVSAILGLVALYGHVQVVTAARSAGVKGI